ncbi:TonB-dependent receptor [Enterovirga rhinocerotis]|nr:TonB-dependent siderophore receptor [Enterovirga rhinocerotis]
MRAFSLTPLLAGTALGTLMVPLAPETARAQQASDLPPIVVQAPRAAPAPRRPTASTGPSTRAPRAAARRQAAPRIAQPIQPVASAASQPAAPVPGARGNTAAAQGLNLATPGTSGSRLGLTPFQTPASIEIISGQKIRDRGQNTVAEAVTQNGTGITTIGSPGNGMTALTSRGFSGVNSVMNLYDGTRLYVGSGTITFPSDTWNIDRIEVLRGPASVLYGEGAIGGIVNVVPKKATFERVNEIRIGYGSDNTKRLALDSGGAITDQIAYRLNISGNHAEGWLKQNGEFSNLAVSGALLWQAAPNLAFTVTHDYGYQKPMSYFGTPLINGRVPSSIRFNNYNVSDHSNVFRDQITQFKTEWSPTDNLTIRNTAYYLTSNRHWRNAESYRYNAATGQVGRSSFIEIFHAQEQIGNRLDATWRADILGFKNTLVAGFDVNHIAFKNFGNSPYGGTDTVPLFGFNPGVFNRTDLSTAGFRSKTDQAAFFAENRLQLTDQFAVIGGLRYDSIRMKREDVRGIAAPFAKDFDATTYRIGAVYNPLPDTAIYAQYATAVDPVGPLVSLNLTQSQYQLSTGRQVEAGIKQSLWGGRGEITLAGYHIEKDNLLTQTAPGVTQQVGTQSARGFEAAASFVVMEWLRVEGSLALLHARYDRFDERVNATTNVSRRGNRPTDVPNEIANLWVSWAFAPRWEARAGLQYVGATFSDPGNQYKRPSYTLVNASLDYRVTDNSRLSLRGYNLTDEVYATRGSSSTWLLGRPRSVEMSYTVAF